MLVNKSFICIFCVTEQNLFSQDLLFNQLEEAYPPDVIHLGEEIPRQFIRKDAQGGDWIQVSVGEIYDPSKFWILLKEYKDDLDILMDDMQ